MIQRIQIFSSLRVKQEKNKFNQLRTTVKQQSYVFQRQITKLENITFASCKVAQLIAKDKRPFTDSDFVKKCMMAVAETVCSEKIKLFSGFSFSARTITRRIRKISENVKYNQKDCCDDLKFFSITINESTDTTDTAQLAVFVSGVNGNFHVIENFVQLLPMMGTFIGADILKPFHQCLEAINFNLSKPVSTTTDRAPSMVEKIQVFCSCFKSTS